MPDGPVMKNSRFVGDPAIFVESGDIRIRVMDARILMSRFRRKSGIREEQFFSIPTNCPAETYTRARKCPKKKEA